MCPRAQPLGGLQVHTCEGQTPRRTGMSRFRFYSTLTAMVFLDMRFHLVLTTNTTTSSSGSSGA